MPSRRFRLGQSIARIAFRVEQLPLEIALLHVIPVNDAQRSDPGTHQQGRLYRAQGTATDDYGGRSGKMLLAFSPKRSKAGLSAETILIERFHESGRIVPLVG